MTPRLATLLFLLGFLHVPTAGAGVFTTPRFVEQGSFAIGFEPELTLSDGAGLGANLRATYGLTELNNVQFIVGTGGGERRFRIGGNATFDVFPDVQGQPGIGIAAQALYQRYEEDLGQLEVTAIPYIHKAVISGTNEVEPFFAFPAGVGFDSEGRYRSLATAVIGSYFKPEGKVRYVFELGVEVHSTQTYLSGGLMYFY